MTRLDLIIFDLDGTLIDSRLDIANSVNYMLKELGLDCLENEQIYSFVGKGGGELVKRCLSEANMDKFDAAMSLFNRYYSEHLLDFTALYPDVRDTLDHFRSKRRSVVTNKDESQSLDIMRGLHIYDCFDKIVGGNGGLLKKPHPEQINLVLKELKADPNKTLMVGDGDVDIKAGKNAGIHTCGVTYGFGSKEELLEAGADVVIDNIIDLKKHFL